MSIEKKELKRLKTIVSDDDRLYDIYETDKNEILSKIKTARKILKTENLSVNDFTDMFSYEEITYLYYVLEDWLLTCEDSWGYYDYMADDLREYFSPIVKEHEEKEREERKKRYNREVIEPTAKALEIVKDLSSPLDFTFSYDMNAPKWTWFTLGDRMPTTIKGPVHLTAELTLAFEPKLKSQDLIGDHVITTFITGDSEITIRQKIKPDKKVELIQEKLKNE